MLLSPIYASNLWPVDYQRWIWEINSTLPTILCYFPFCFALDYLSRSRMFPRKMVATLLLLAMVAMLAEQSEGFIAFFTHKDFEVSLLKNHAVTERTFCHSISFSCSNNPFTSLSLFLSLCLWSLPQSMGIYPRLVLEKPDHLEYGLGSNCRGFKSGFRIVLKRKTCLF